MGDKDKSKSSIPARAIPKDGQVIMAIMNEMGITEYDPKTTVQLNEFVYRYSTSILEEARVYANNCKKKFIDCEDVRTALVLANEISFTTPPSREVLLECARLKNGTPLPTVKPHCGLRLPPDRQTLTATNYRLKSHKTRPIPAAKATGVVVAPNIKIMTKPGSCYLKRTSNAGPMQKQNVTLTKTSVIGQQTKSLLKPKIQIQHTTMHDGNLIDSNILKRKREDDEM